MPIASLLIRGRSESDATALGQGFFSSLLARDLASGNFLAHRRNLVLVWGTGTGRTHLVIAITRACIRDCARGRFFNVVDLVNKLEGERRAPGDRAGWLTIFAERISRCSTSSASFAQSGGQLLFRYSI